MKFKVFILAFIIITLSTGSDVIAQDNDSVYTAFRKDRWLTGLSGSISSTTIKFENSTTTSTSDNYGINIESGRFIKDRLLVGVKFQTNRTNTSGVITGAVETFYIGPSVNYYFMNSKTGSLFAKLSLGYLRYLDETQLMTQDQLIQESSEGDGFGSVLSLGYAYTINDYVALDIGMNVNLFWVKIKQVSMQSQTITNTGLSTNELAFTFGFNIIVDDFFF